MKKTGLIVSACLLGRPCRYNGEDKRHPGIIRFLRGKKYLAVCPEMLAGWGSPRLPVEFHGGGAAEVATGGASIQDSRGRNRTASLMRGIRKALRRMERLKPGKAVLKEKSPSCGVERVYRDGRLTRGEGLFTYWLRKKGIEVCSEKDFTARRAEKR